MTTHILQSEHPRPASRRDIALSVLVPVAVATVANFAVALLDLPAKLYWAHRLISDKWRLVQADRPRVDWLVLGDSSGNQAVDPEVIRDECGAAALNVCTIGDCLIVGDAWMLADYVERHGAPEKAVLVHVWDTWPNARIPPQILARMPIEGAFWERFQPPYPIGWRDRFDVFASRWLPLYSQSLSLSDAVLKLPLRLIGLERIEMPHMGDDGFSAFATPNPDVVTRDCDLHLRTLAEADVTISECNRQALRRIAALAEAHDFEVVVLTGPVAEQLGASEPFRRALESIEAQVRAALDGAPGEARVRVLVRDPARFATSELSNADHVVGPAAERYTRWLVGRVLDREPSR